jgi:prefoldin beta subunit
MDMDQETQKKVQGLQLIEQSFQGLLMQKQTFQIELNETKTALDEVSKSKGDVFRVLGQVMVKADAEELKKELKEKHDLLDLRMKSIEKQELSLREEIERMRAEIMDKIK